MLLFLPGRHRHQQYVIPSALFAVNMLRRGPVEDIGKRPDVYSSGTTRDARGVGCPRRDPQKPVESYFEVPRLT